MYVLTDASRAYTKIPAPTLSASRSGSTITISISGKIPNVTYYYGTSSTQSLQTTQISTTATMSSNSSYTFYAHGEANNIENSDNSNAASVGSYNPTPTVSTPSISFDSSTNEVTITCSTSGATIYYRIGTSGSYSAYGGPFTINETSTIYAYATRSGYNTSSTTSKVCTVTTPTLPTPSVDVEFYNGSSSSDSSDWSMWDITITNYSSFPSGTTFSCTFTCGTDSGSFTMSSSTYRLSTDYYNNRGMSCVVKITAKKSGYNDSAQGIGSGSYG